MSVYVDELVRTAKTCRWPFTSACHMFADDTDELHHMAARMGLKRAWFQPHRDLEHYDLTRGMRSKAVAMGAVEVDRKFVVAMIRKRRSSIPV